MIGGWRGGQLGLPDSDSVIGSEGTEASGEINSSYVLLEHIARYQIYPLEARARHIEGHTVMRAQPLPRIPPGLAAPMAIELPVDFALTSWRATSMPGCSRRAPQQREARARAGRR